MECLRIIVQHHEGIYWCPAPLHDEDQHSYKVRDVADVQAAPPPPVDEYVSDSMMGSDSEAPATSCRALSKVVAPRRTRQTTGKIPASQAATQIAEAKKRRGKQTRSAVSVDTTIMSSDVEAIDVEDDEGDVQSSKATTALSPAGQATETSLLPPGAQGRSTSSTGPVDDVGLNKRLNKAPPKTCKPNLRSTTKYVRFPTHDIALYFFCPLVVCLGHLFMSRVPPMTSESGKNASGQEAFGSKVLETPVVESPVASAADVTSAAVGAGATAASEVDKAGNSAPPTTGGEGGDSDTASP
jgi:hypothetical protein